MTAQKRILFLSLSDDVGSDRIVSEFGRLGAACAVMGPAGGFAGLSRFIDRRFPLSRRIGVWATTLGLCRRLATVEATWRPDWIVPVDELSALILRSIGTAPSTPEALRALIHRSLGHPDGYRAACHRLPLMEAARRLGVRVPTFHEATERDVAMTFPAVVKRDHSSGSGGVAVAADRAELVGILRRFLRRQRIKSTLAALAGYSHGAAPILVQSFVEGRLAMRTVACRDGRVLDGMNFAAVRQHPEKGFSTMLQPCLNAEMDTASEAIVGELGCSGLVSFDFIVDREERAFLIEMNPRPIGSTHLGRLFGHDLCAALLNEEGTWSERPMASLPTDQVVALFPKELERDPSGSAIGRGSGIVHDVPLDEPAIVEAYLRHLAVIHPTGADDMRRRLGVLSPIETDRAPWRQPTLAH